MLAIQEAHSTTETNQTWKDYFYPKCSYWSHYTAIIIDQKIPHSNLQVLLDERVMTIDLSWNGTKVTLVNVYAPTNSTKRSYFFNSLSSLKFNYPIILLGDLNQIDHPIFDHYPPLKTQPLSWKAFTSLKINHNLIDLAPIRKNTLKNMTRVDPKVGSSSRIDYIFSSYDISSFFSKHETKMVHISDHSMVCIAFDVNKEKYCKTWKKILPFQAKSNNFSNWLTSYKGNFLNLGAESIFSTWKNLKESATKFNSHNGSRLARKNKAKIRKLKKIITHLENFPPKKILS